ncbi:MAG: VCBS repeat-containing protein, partial [Proteobacteria bacterium]
PVKRRNMSFPRRYQQIASISAVFAHIVRAKSVQAQLEALLRGLDSDGLLDIVTSGWGLEEQMHYHQNKGDGTFVNLSASSGIDQTKGGLNIIQTDYNNDGFKDIFVLRGAWLRSFGQQPNSLLRNNGDNTFTDVTIESGLLSFHPTQTATWADFNNDGWLDVFIGNETTSLMEGHPCELYINNTDGTFSNVAKSANCDLRLFVKGVTSGDFDNDGKIDLFISTMNGRKVLLKNDLGKKGKLKFKDVSNNSGINLNPSPTFSTWFWDYDNDGQLDLLCAGYDASTSLAKYAAQDALNIAPQHRGGLFVYRNLGNGKFKDVSAELGFGKSVFAMGSNYGDINSDGYLDIYLGTGNPLFQSQIPNKMFLNLGGNGFADVTSSARVGSLQKGHGVSFGDLNKDGDLDIHIDMGGAYEGDAYQNSLFI